MAGNTCAWSKRGNARARALRGYVRNTYRALSEVADILDIDPEITASLGQVDLLSNRPTVLVLLGTSPAARARLTNAILGQKLLDERAPNGWRWVRIQYGSSKQAQLILGNSEFELVVDLESNKRPWDTVPLEDLLRQDQTDLQTVLEIELNNQFLKDGLKILIPPDLNSEQQSDKNYEQMKKNNSELQLRELILKSYNHVYLYCVDRIGGNIFADELCYGESTINDQDFWSTYNLYYMAKSVSGIRDIESANGNEKTEMVSRVRKKEDRYVFDYENCIDLHQIKDLNRNAQIFFYLLSDSVDVTSHDKCHLSNDSSNVPFSMEATESTEDYRTEDLPESDRNIVDQLRQKAPIQKTAIEERRLYEEQCAFMNELLDQWEMISPPKPKHNLKSQWTILDDRTIQHAATQKHSSESLLNSIQNGRENSTKGCREANKVIKSRTALLNKTVKFASECLQSSVLEYCSRLSEVHVKLVQQCIMASFDCARELQIVPKKIQFVASQEQQLYESLVQKFNQGETKQELIKIMQQVLHEMKLEINNMDWSVDDLPCHQDKRYAVSNSVFYQRSQISDSGIAIQLSSVNKTDALDTSQLITSQSSDDQSGSDVEEAESYDSYNFDDYEIIHSPEPSFTISDCHNQLKTLNGSQVNSIAVENESVTQNSDVSYDDDSSNNMSCPNTTRMSIKQASLDVQKTVLSKLSRKISLKLVKFVDCLKDNYFGTLQRCLDSLESSCREELGGRPASEAISHLVSVAARVDLSPKASYCILHQLVDSLRRLLHKLGMSNGGFCCVLSSSYRRSVAFHTINTLSHHTLAHYISRQILDRLNVTHEKYQSALCSLEMALASRLHHTEDVKLALRKKYAPALARLCLESTSMCDLLMYGMPELGREIGRGQYGVVYNIRGGWAGHSRVCGKSVLPTDERHYHELAMEFFYTRSIPPHERIVRLYGSLVQPGSNGGGAVLLLAPRYVRDLHAAVAAGLEPQKRAQVAVDVLEAIRYLHSLGLVHRDVKMKNVLLDGSDRAALADLGFCCCGGLVSGSVVGTPVHMAPELASGLVHGPAVDVFAWGVLLWYLCAGATRLPKSFEPARDKESLWRQVRAGLRPDSLPHFTQEAIEVMQACWRRKPEERPHPADLMNGLYERLLPCMEAAPMPVRD